MINIDADTILVTVVTEAILFRPASVQILLPQSLWIVASTFRQPTCCDVCVLLVRRALLGDRRKRCIDDRVTAGLKALRTEDRLDHLEWLLDDLRFDEPLSEKKPSWWHHQARFAFFEVLLQGSEPQRWRGSSDSDLSCRRVPPTGKADRFGGSV